MKQILRKIYSRFPLSFGLKLPQEVIEQEIEKIIK